MESKLAMLFIFISGIVLVDSLPVGNNAIDMNNFLPKNVEHDLLRSIGISESSRSPRIRREDIQVPAEMREKYMSLLHKHRERRGIIAKGIRKIAGIPGQVEFANESRQHFSFRMLDRVPIDSEVIIAELKVFKDSPNRVVFFDHSNHSHRHHPIGARVSVRYFPNGMPEDEAPDSIVDDRLISANSSGWKVFDVTAAVHKWLDRPTSTLDLWMHVDPVFHGRHAKRIAKEVRFGTEIEPDSRVGFPILTIYTVKYIPEDDAIDCKQDVSHELQRCCRVPKYVDIRNMQFANRWIIEPRGFEAFDCMGTCSSHHHQQPKNSERSSFPRFFRPGQSNYRTCGASKTTPLPMMYLVEKDGVTELQVEEIPNMIIEECSCLR